MSFFCFQQVLWSVEAYRAHFLALAFKTSLRGCPVPSWVVQVLCMGFIGFPCDPGDIALSLSFSLFLFDSSPPRSQSVKDHKSFSSSHVWMWELDYKESWVQKNWCFWTVVLEKTLESPLDCREIQPVHPKGDQSWVIGRTDVEAETLILWPPDAKSWLIWKDPDAGKDQGQEEKETEEDEMVGWHHWLNRHEFGWTLGVGDGQGVVHGVSKSRTWLSDWTELNWKLSGFN